MLRNPFFAVTKTDGKFSIANLPPGTYEIEAWHEKLGTQKATVTVGARTRSRSRFKFSAPPRSRAGGAGATSEGSDGSRPPRRTTARAHDAHHEELGFWRKYVFSTDHKTIGIQYARHRACCSCSSASA